MARNIVHLRSRVNIKCDNNGNVSVYALSNIETEMTLIRCMGDISIQNNHASADCHIEIGVQIQPNAVIAKAMGTSHEAIGYVADYDYMRKRISINDGAVYSNPSRVQWDTKGMRKLDTADYLVFVAAEGGFNLDEYTIYGVIDYWFKET